MIDLSNILRPQATTHTLSATTSSGATQTSAFAAEIQTIMVTATSGCFVAFGASPTAATTSTYIAADTPYLFRVNGSDKCAAITGTGTASVYITEMSR